LCNVKASDPCKWESKKGLLIGNFPKKEKGGDAKARQIAEGGCGGVGPTISVNQKSRGGRKGLKGTRKEIMTGQEKGDLCDKLNKSKDSGGP